MGFILGSLMLSQEVKEILNDFDNIPTDRIVEILTQIDRKSTRLNSSHIQKSRMPSSA